MGQESSSPVDEKVRPRTLSSRDVDAVAEYIKSGKVRRIVVMTGAGISTSAGIPDFRSPETGLYANLARLNLPFAEAVFDISYFRNNPEPFYTLAHELYPGKFRPTITHSFIALLHKKGLLHKLFTQNIDCLEREAGVPGEAIVEAHGSFATQRCIDCRTKFPDDKMKDMVNQKKIPRCKDETCGGLVKPDIVFFGEQLPASFFENRDKLGEADLAIVMGTSLTVFPFAALPNMIAEDAPRVLINKEQVSSLGSRPDDVLLLGDCDDGVRKLARALGWLDELEKLWEQTGDAFPDANNSTGKTANDPEKSKDADEALEQEIDKLTTEVDRSLRLTHQHLERHLEEKNKKMLREDMVSPPSDKMPSARPTSESGDGVGLSHVFPHLKL